MNELTDNSGAHALDGIDPDAPQNSRYGPRGHAARLAEDLRELDNMSKDDIIRYCGTPRGTARNTNRKR